MNNFRFSNNNDKPIKRKCSNYGLFEKPVSFQQAAPFGAPSTSPCKQNMLGESQHNNNIFNSPNFASSSGFTFSSGWQPSSPFNASACFSNNASSCVNHNNENNQPNLFGNLPNRLTGGGLSFSPFKGGTFAPNSSLHEPFQQGTQEHTACSHSFTSASCSAQTSSLVHPSFLVPEPDAIDETESDMTDTSKKIKKVKLPSQNELVSSDHWDMQTEWSLETDNQRLESNFNNQLSESNFNHLQSEPYLNTQTQQRTSFSRREAVDQQAMHELTSETGHEMGFFAQQMNGGNGTSARVFRICVKLLNGTEGFIDCLETDEMGTVKERLEAQTGIRFDQQRLIFNGTTTADEKTILDYGISNGSVLHLVLALRGGNATFELF